MQRSMMAVSIMGTAHARELVVDVVAESRSVDNSKRNADAILLEFCFRSAPCPRLWPLQVLTNVDRLDLDALLEMGRLRAVADLVLQDLGLAKGVHKGGSSGTRGTCRGSGLSFCANTVALY